jgi:hypothetical protein
VRFWDTSAVVPLLVEQDATPQMDALFAEDSHQLVWWGTAVECASAMARLERDGDLTDADVRVALERLDAAATAWSEVEAVDAVRRTARRLLRVHPLRAADALQVAAAIVACEGDSGRFDVVTLDHRLADAARREGFRVLPAAV